MVHLQAIEKGQGTIAGLSLEECGELRGRIAHIFDDLLHADMILDIFLHIVYRGVHYVGKVFFFYLSLVGHPVLIKVTHRSQVMIQQ